MAGVEVKETLPAAGHGRSFGGFRDFIEAAGLITTGPSSGDRLIGTDVSSIRA
jgi:hypothetical protein